MSFPAFRIQIASAYVDPPRWDDLRVPFTATNRGGANDPLFNQFRDDASGSVGVYAYEFISGARRDLLFTCQLPHCYKQGTDLEVHVHYSPADNGAGNVTWEVEYTIANPDFPPPPVTALFPPTQIISRTTAIAANTAFHHYRSEIGTIPGRNVVTGQVILVSAMIVGRISRSTVGNTYAASLWGHELDFHYRIDNIGSNLEYQKTDSGRP